MDNKYKVTVGILFLIGFLVFYSVSGSVIIESVDTKERQVIEGDETTVIVEVNCSRLACMSEDIRIGTNNETVDTDITEQDGWLFNRDIVRGRISVPESNKDRLEIVAQTDNSEESTSLDIVNTGLPRVISVSAPDEAQSGELYGVKTEVKCEYERCVSASLSVESSTQTIPRLKSEERTQVMTSLSTERTGKKVIEAIIGDSKSTDILSITGSNNKAYIAGINAPNKVVVNETYQITVRMNCQSPSCPSETLKLNNETKQVQTMSNDEIQEITYNIRDSEPTKQKQHKIKYNTNTRQVNISVLGKSNLVELSSPENVPLGEPATITARINCPSYKCSSSELLINDDTPIQTHEIPEIENNYTKQLTVTKETVGEYTISAEQANNKKETTFTVYNNTGLYISSLQASNSFANDVTIETTIKCDNKFCKDSVLYITTDNSLINQKTIRNLQKGESLTRTFIHEPQSNNQITITGEINNVKKTDTLELNNNQNNNNQTIDDTKPPVSIQFNDKTINEGSQTVTVDSARVGNQSVPGDEFVVVIHRTGGLYGNEIGPKIGESMVLPSGAQENVEVRLSASVSDNDDIEELTRSQRLIAMLHKTSEPGASVNHGPHITRDGSKITSGANITVIQQDNNNSQLPTNTCSLKPDNTIQVHDTMDGDGTQSNPYIITNTTQLQSLRHEPNKNYRLGNDIDASKTKNCENGFTPYDFRGFLDGNGYNIKNLYSQQGSGLIDNSDGIVKNLSVINATVLGNSSSNVGVIARNQEGGVISNVKVSGNVTGSKNVGGLIGKNYGSVNNSYAKGNVTGDRNVGGLVGRNYGSVNTSYAKGNVTGDDAIRVGGLIGDNGGSINNSYAKGNVTGDDAIRVGGLIGDNSGIDNDGSVNNSYSVGNVTGTREVGGLIGGTEGSVNNSYSIGNVTGNDVGGAIGFKAGGSIEDVYWDEVSSGQSSSGDRVTSTTGFNTDSDGDGRADEMIGASAASNMTGFDFTNIWKTVPNEYPKLRSSQGKTTTGQASITKTSITPNNNPVETVTLTKQRNASITVELTCEFDSCDTNNTLEVLNQTRDIKQLNKSETVTKTVNFTANNSKTITVDYGQESTQRSITVIPDKNSTVITNFSVPDSVETGQQFDTTTTVGCNVEICESQELKVAEIGNETQSVKTIQTEKLRGENTTNSEQVTYVRNNSSEYTFGTSFQQINSTVENKDTVTVTSSQSTGQASITNTSITPNNNPVETVTLTKQRNASITVELTCEFDSCDTNNTLEVLNQTRDIKQLNKSETVTEAFNFTANNNRTITVDYGQESTQRTITVISDKNSTVITNLSVPESAETGQQFNTNTTVGCNVEICESRELNVAEIGNETQSLKTIQTQTIEGEESTITEIANYVRNQSGNYTFGASFNQVNSSVDNKDTVNVSSQGSATVQSMNYESTQQALVRGLPENSNNITAPENVPQFNISEEFLATAVITCEFNTCSATSVNFTGDVNETITRNVQQLSKSETVTKSVTINTTTSGVLSMKAAVQPGNGVQKKAEIVNTETTGQCVEPDNVSQIHDTMAGDGTQQNPYIITNCAQLQSVKHEASKYYELGNNIDASNTRDWNNGSGFNPYEFGTFGGVLDGNGHKIENLYSQQRSALFTTNSGNITNMSVINATVSAPSSTSVGVIAGNQDGGVISNVYASGNVTGDSSVGGLVGRNGDGPGLGGIIKSSYADVKVTGDGTAGGLVGVNLEGSIYNLDVSINNSHAEGNVTGKGNVGGLVGRNVININNSYSVGNVTGDSDVGGLVGLNAGNINNSYAEGNVNGSVENVGGLAGRDRTGTIKNSYSVGNVIGEKNVGGLVGFHKSGFIKTSYSVGNVTGNIKVGGLVGKNARTSSITDGPYSTIDKSYAKGNVTGDDEVGGLVGRNSDGIIQNSYSVGNVTGSSNVGGAIGVRSSEGSIEDVYWDEIASGQSSSGSGVASTTGFNTDVDGDGRADEMIGDNVIDNMTWLDFELVWKPVPNGYPVLRENPNPSGTLISRIQSSMDGDGSQSNPYVITNATQLQSVILESNKNYTLGNNIDASNTRNWKGERGFVPYNFGGVLDGNGHKIENLYSQQRSALFTTNSGNITNMSVINATVSAPSSANGVGVIAGIQDDGGVISNVKVSGRVTGEDDVGGIVGKNGDSFDSNSSIKSSYADVTVTGLRDVGGLVGKIRSSTVKNSYSVGNVTGQFRVGGLVGTQDSGSINNSYSVSNVTGDSGVGGLVGSHDFGSINNSYSVGNVTSNGTVGGAVGFNSVGNFGSIEDVYWDEIASGQSSSGEDITSTTGFDTDVDGDGRADEMIGASAESNMTGFDFTSVWETVPDDYPRLRDLNGQ